MSYLLVSYPCGWELIKLKFQLRNEISVFLICRVHFIFSLNSDCWRLNQIWPADSRFSSNINHFCLMTGAAKNEYWWSLKSIWMNWQSSLERIDVEWTKLKFEWMVLNRQWMIERKRIRISCYVLNFIT